jgi:choline monooxygenase
MAIDLSDYRPSPDVARASTLPARWYVDPALLAAEQEAVFARTWQWAGASARLANPGDFVTCEVAGDPLFAVRGRDGALRAFWNVCPHRAGRIVEGCGNAPALQCRYHGWTYRLDGALLKAREMEGVESFRPDQVRLRPARIDELAPLTFVNLDGAAPSLAEFLGEIPAEIAAAGFRLSELVPFERRDYTLAANWKVYVDNYLEGYHVPIAHPGLYRAIDYDRYQVAPRRFHSAQYAPLRSGDETRRMLGRDRRYLRGDDEERALYYWVFPNLMFNLYADNLQLNAVLPLGLDRTLTIFEWFVHPDLSPEKLERLRESIAFSDEIQREDVEVCEAVQLGLRSRAYDAGRFSAKRENGVHHFHLLLHEYLSRPSLPAL